MALTGVAHAQSAPPSESPLRQNPSPSDSSAPTDATPPAGVPLTGAPQPDAPLQGEPSAPLAPIRPEPVAAATAEPPRPSTRIGADGFVLESEDRAFSLKLRGYLQADGRYFIDAGRSGPPSTFLIRRARPIIEGTLYRYFGYRVMPDFGGGTTTLQDAYIEARPLRELSFRVGKFKAPFGIERLASATNLFFVERAFPTSLAPNRDLGAEIYGEFGKGDLTYAIGLFNGVADGASSDGDTDKSKDATGRIFAHPLRSVAIPALHGLGIGVAGSWGRSHGTFDASGLSALKTSGQQTFFRYLAGDSIANTVVANGDRYRLSPQLYYFVGPLGLLGEYVASSQNVTIGQNSRRLTNQAWQAAATFVVGGDASYEGVRPTRTVDAGGPGACEVTARYHELRIDSNAFPTFADPAKSARLARGYTVGLGWWANRAFRVMADFDRTTFEGGAAGGDNRRAENVVLARTQVAW